MVFNEFSVKLSQKRMRKTWGRVSNVEKRGRGKVYVFLPEYWALSIGVHMQNNLVLKSSILYYGKDSVEEFTTLFPQSVYCYGVFHSKINSGRGKQVFCLDL